MSNPSGDYVPFVGLGFTGLRFFQDGSQYVGGLYYEENEYSIAISGGTYTDATRVVTFSVHESPAGVTDVNFIGNVIVDSTGNVTAMVGTWTGHFSLNLLPRGARAKAAIPKYRPILPIPSAQGPWMALNRENIIE
ncbi:hypothetical protein [Mycobacterium sp.]|uniref:hypothetical protein n=1 Tax=Mycobacterium sp. TaxID=1785 RepID=UPI002BB8F580|nr:hypothetical protein [Mycobacterium sp.]HME50531.1 hypothetical protein [Mycobacterium sp.]